MALAVAPKRGRERKWWDERARNNSGISLEDIARQSKLSHNGHDNVAYFVLPDISAFSHVTSNGMNPAELEAHNQDVEDFNAWYNNRGVEAVKNSHDGLFGRVIREAYDAAVHGLGYVANLVPAPARKALMPAGLAASLLSTACSGSGPERAYADARINSDKVDTRYDPARGILNITIPVDYVSSSNKPIQGVVEVYRNSISVDNLVDSKEGILNPGKGTDFIVQASVPFGGNFTYFIVVKVPQDSNPDNNIAQVAVNATPTPPIPTETYKPELAPTAVPPTPPLTYTPAPTPTNTPTKTPATPMPVPATATPPIATSTPSPSNSYDFAKSLGLDAAYLKDVVFDSNSKTFVSYLASLPAQMRAIAERSGLLEDILADKQVDAKESVFLNRLIGSYQNEIKTMQPWLSQISEKEITAALALNLRNFNEADKKGMLIYSLQGERVPSLLSPALFFADGVKRMYEDEIILGKRAPSINAHATVAVKNITNFPKIHNKSLEVANSPNAVYQGRSIDEILHAGYFEAEAVGSTDKGLNAYEDMKLLLESGSDAAKAALRIYARNLTREGRQGSAPQVRVPLTMIDAWSIGIDSIGVVLYGHDVPAISVTDEDITLLKKRSPDTLLIIDIGDKHYLPIQWTRQGIVPKGIDEIIQIYTPNAPISFKISDLKPY